VAAAREALARFEAIGARVDPGVLIERSLPVHPALATLFPAGLPRGATIAVTGDAAVSSAFVLLSAATRAGSWSGVVGVAGLGARAAAEAGVDLCRLIMVRDAPGHRDDERWAQVLGALVDGFDLVVVGMAERVRPVTARRVQARVQVRGSVLVVLGDPGPFSCDLRLVSRARWEGLGDGHGHLRSREVAVVLEGRRVPRPRRSSLCLPDAAGRVVPALAPLGRVG
jgi:hypothetical protein